MFLDTSILLENGSNKEPFNFYHLVDKDADLSKGLLTLQYFYNNKMYYEFDRYSYKYRFRLCNGWGIYPNRDPESLTREEIIKGINKFRHTKYGCQSIYLFKYPPYEELGPRMKEILSNKQIVKVNINDSKLKPYLHEIYWGHWMSYTGNEKLNRKYYENVTREEYFKYYDDNDPMSFATLNHIGLFLKSTYLPKKFIKEMEN